MFGGDNSAVRAGLHASLLWGNEELPKSVPLGGASQPRVLEPGLAGVMEEGYSFFFATLDVAVFHIGTFEHREE